jgi:hypothetical protein
MPDIALPNSPGKTAPSPYNLTALLVSQLIGNVAAAGIIRRKDGTIERKTWPKENMARYSDCTHAFVITRAPATWAAGIAVVGARALNPDIVYDAAPFDQLAGLFSCPAGQVPA